MKFIEKLEFLKNKRVLYVLILCIITLLGFVIVPTYAKFASNFVTEDDIVGMDLSFDVSITGVEEYQEIEVGAGDSYKFNVQVRNSGEDTVYYGIWYKMVNPSELPSDGSIEIGKLLDTNVSPSGEIAGGESITASVGLINKTSSDVIIYLGISSSSVGTGDIEYLDGKTLITGEVAILDADIEISSIVIDGTKSTILPTNGVYSMDYTCIKDSTLRWDTITKSIVYEKGSKVGDKCSVTFTSSANQVYLNEMPVGSYVKYVGSGGTVGSTSVACQINGQASSSTASAETESPNSCLGQNAREDINTYEKLYGYCFEARHSYYTTGWRLAYVDSKSRPIIVSAGSPECNTRVSSGANVTYIQTANAKALKYCNVDYVDGDCSCIDNNGDGLCDSASTDAWALNDTDFYYITKAISGFGKRLSYESSNLGDGGDSMDSLSCEDKYSYKQCGYNNDLLDNGGYYWFAAAYDASDIEGVGTYGEYGMFWSPASRAVGSGDNRAFGLRPVVALSSGIYVTGGSGTMDDPYMLANNSFTVNDGNLHIKEDGKSSVNLSFIGEMAHTMCISVDNSECTNYVNFSDSYTLDLSSEEDGEVIVYVYYKNSSGALIASLSKTIIIDSVAPSDNSIVIGEDSSLKRTLTLSSTGADYMCFLNENSDVNQCTKWVNYDTSYDWRLSDGIGNKTVYAFFKDLAGNVSSASATIAVTSIAYNVTEDFSDTDYDVSITISDGATYPWSVVDGQFRSTNKNQSSTTSSSNIIFTPSNDATLSFDYGVSSESGWDKLTITLTGSDSTSNTIANAISGTSNNSATGISLKSGVTYTLKLSYAKDSSGNNGSDIGYIDNLVIES